MFRIDFIQTLPNGKRRRSEFSISAERVSEIPLGLVPGRPQRPVEIDPGEMDPMDLYEARTKGYIVIRSKRAQAHSHAR